jgi:hypothetical protein
MSAFKPFVTSDVTVSPFIVNKTFTFNGATEMGNVGIDRFIGQNIQENLWISGSNPTGTVNPNQDTILIYNSIVQLYYSNYISGSNGSPTHTASFNPDGTVTGDIYTPSYDNYLSTTLSPGRYIPTGSNEYIGVYSIPSTIFGEYVKPRTFSLSTSIGSFKITDDGEGKLYYNNMYLVGNIIYEHGIAILYDVPSSLYMYNVYGTMIYGSGSYMFSMYPYGVYGDIIYDDGVYGSPFSIIENFIIGTDITCSFQSTVTIYETQYKCTLRQNEFTFSQNPTLIVGSSNSGIISDFATGSYFNPYITSVGLYNNNKELVAVAKLSQPLPVSSITDTSILINLDL